MMAVAMKTQDEHAAREILLEALDPVRDKLSELGIGYVPPNLTTLLVNACIVVLDTVNDIDNYHMQEETSFVK